MNALARACLAGPLGALACMASTAGGHAPLPPARMTASEIAARPALGAIAGTSGLSGLRTIVVAGDPAHAGTYTIELLVPAHTRIEAHTHRDDRTAVVLSGTWHFGYGNRAEDAATKSLGPGSFYTEPANLPHFAHTDAEPVAVIITGSGPTDTRYVAVRDASAVPHGKRP